LGCTYIGFIEGIEQEKQRKKGQQQAVELPERALV
jgi:hypothetical protein